MILNIITLIFIIVKSTRCSIVHDGIDQNTIYVSEYCPNQKYCREGTHVMCMYYDQGREFGPRCGNPVKTEITHKMVQKILKNVNDVRGRIASGTEKGKNDEVLPRAYGMMKMEWDRELATFAQVLANQCLGGRGDICRATDKFPNPSQSIAIVHYKYPNWDYLRHNSTEKGLNEEKLIFAVDKFIKSAHALKKTLTTEIITNCPPLHELPDNNLKYYLNLIRGGATHIGCGVSAYSKYKIDGNTESIQNSVQVVCNISDEPQPTQPLYNTDPPIQGEGLSKRCGCPKGYQETQYCLCEKEMEYPWTITTTTSPPHHKFETTFETLKIKDPISKLSSLRLGQSRPQHNPQREDFMPDISHSVEKQTKSDESNCQISLGAQPMLSIKDAPSEKLTSSRNHGIESLRGPSRNRNISVWRGKSTEDYQSREKKGDKMEDSDEIYKMSRTLIPKKKHNNSRFAYETNVPAKKLSSELRVSKPQNHKQEFKPVSTTTVEDSFNAEEVTTESALNIAGGNLVDNCQNSKQKNCLRNNEINNFNEENKRNDNKRLIHILSMLEQEVKIIEFDDNLKQLFDSKMKNIYESAVKKNQKALSSVRAKKLYDTANNLKEIKQYLENKYSTNIEDEINILRKESELKDNRPTYVENEINPNQNYDYVDRKSDETVEPKYINNMDKKMDNPYEEIIGNTDLNSKTSNKMHWLTERPDIDISYNDILNRKYHLDHPNDGNDNPQNNFETRNQEMIAPDNKNDARKAFSSNKQLDYKSMDKYDEKKSDLDMLREINDILKTRKVAEGNYKPILINGKDRRLDMNKDVKSTGRRTISFPKKIPQYSNTFNRINTNEEMRPIRLLRQQVQNIPQIIKTDDMRNIQIRSNNPPQRPAIYSSDREIFNN